MNEIIDLGVHKWKFYAMLVLAVLTVFTSCKSNDEPEDMYTLMGIDQTWIEPIDSSNPKVAEVKAFLSHLPTWTDISEFYYHTRIENEEEPTQCMIINSAEDWDLFFPPDLQGRPEIDFYKYTLIIGYADGTPYKDFKIMAKEMNGRIIIKIPSHLPSYSSPALLVWPTFSFYLLYSKLKGDKVTKEVVYL